METKYRYCKCLFAPFRMKNKLYTFATTQEDLACGMTVYFERRGVLHELIFYEYCDAPPRGKYHIKVLLERAVTWGYRNCS